MALNHLHLHVADTDRAAAFYGEWFGFRPHARHGAIVFLRDDAEVDLALAAKDDVEPWPAGVHFGFRMGDGDEVRALHGRLQRALIEGTGELVDEDDFVGFRTRDPDGHLIEVYFE